MSVALSTGQPYLDILQWEPEEVATALLWIDEQADAKRDAQK